MKVILTFLSNAKEKIKKKNLDAIILNSLAGICVIMKL